VDIDEMYERLVDFFGEYGSGNPRVLVERNIALLRAKKKKTEEEAIKSLYEKHEKKITKLYAKHKGLMEKSVTRAEKRKLEKKQPVPKPDERETEKALQDSEELTSAPRISPLSPLVIFFYVMGAVIILLSLLSLFFIPWNLVEPPLSWIYMLNWLVSFSVGVTEIAVGWLLDGEFQRKR
jgi:Flp pilus assembly protein TadB